MKGTVHHGVQDFAGVARHVFAWVADANGDVLFRMAPGIIAGSPYRLVTAPGTTAPTDNYDITIVSWLGLDLLQGFGADRDTATVEQEWIRQASDHAASPPPSHCWYEFTVANAGAGGVGVAVLYCR